MDEPRSLPEFAGRDADETHGILVSKGEALRVVRALAKEGAHDAR